MADACFQMKSTTVAAVVLDIHNFSEDFFLQLQAKIDSAPMFFQRAPIVFDLTDFDTEANGPLPADQFALIVRTCREQGLQPMACKGAGEHLAEVIEQLRLVNLPAAPTRKMEIPADAPDVASTESAQDDVEPQSELALSANAEQTEAPSVIYSHRPSKVVTKPVRSGQQVYAEGADLILMAPVSEGAEVLADGHIHVYGVLRGRALAGVKGDTEARIFCQQLEAELVSVAGQFILNDKIRDLCWKKPAQIYLKDESIQIDEI